MYPDDDNGVETADVRLRPEIALSWKRSRISGLDPGAANMRFEPDAARRRTRLITAATPVLSRLADQLSDAPCCVLLADRDSRIADDPVGSTRLRDRLEGVGAVAGGVFLEETTGTNSIATAHELRRGVLVHGEEHFLEPFKAFSCYGQPIVHPVTRRLEGVLDITCLSADYTPLLKPIVAQSIRDVEANLLEIGRRTERRLLAEFQIATSGHDRPVIGVAAGVILASPAATELLSPADHSRLSMLAAEMTVRPARRSAERTEVIELLSGQLISARMRVVEPGLDAVLLELTPVPLEHDAEQGNSQPLNEATAVTDRPVYVGGAPGTGRTTAAHALAGDSPVALLDGADTVADRDWQQLTEMLTQDAATVLIAEDVHLLPEWCGVRLHRLLDSMPNRAVLTGRRVGELTGYSAVLAAACEQHIELTALSERTGDIPNLVRDIAKTVGAGADVHFTAAALAALAAQPWPGNVRELHAVVCASLERRSAGSVTPGDLPERYRSGPRRGVGVLERAEYEAIVGVLRTCGGNKQRAARQLGISRTTLYSRMRALRITG
ncbi:Fis family transcriptional regulator [Nocardia sp. CA2R105]|uniref:sigma-54-dependent Fis family transcriptional regulator n=1 Tax=Nocardia coffeae TaxID=2873381 RepID=UPI001CA78E90|nr:helix-turn-helix domain-containing protein [Nocardia coffeae]MBY8857311.1 Fis family transcriptional regulator [Nocardia coffeae]